MSNKERNRRQSLAPRFLNLSRRYGYQIAPSQSGESLKTESCPGRGISFPSEAWANPAQNPSQSSRTPARSGSSETAHRRSFLRSPGFKPLAFAASFPQGTQTDSPLTAFIITVDLWGPDPSVKAEVKNKYFSRPKMCNLFRTTAGKVVAAQFQIWVPEIFKPPVSRMESVTVEEGVFDIDKLSKMCRIVADIVSPGKITLDVGVAHQEVDLNASDFANHLRRMFNEETRPLFLKENYPECSLDTKQQRQLGRESDVSAIAKASQNLSLFFNVIGRNLQKILKRPGSITAVRTVDESLKRSQSSMTGYLDVVALLKHELKTDKKGKAVLQALRTFVDLAYDSIFKTPVRVRDLHQLKSAVLEYVWYDMIAHRLLLQKATSKDKMLVLLARDVSYEMYRCAFPVPLNTEVKYIRAWSDE